MSVETQQESDSALSLPPLHLEEPSLPPLHLGEPVVKMEQDHSFILRDPTEKQCCQGLIMLRDNFRQVKLERMIQILYINTRPQEAAEGRQSRRGLLDDEEYLSSDDGSEIEKKRMQEEYARKFENSEANPRFYEEREIAKLFCSKGYGYPTAREYLGDSITPNRYNNVITTIVRLSYRKLECYITKYIQPRLQMISREELKMIKTPLVNCRAWMTPAHADNFHRFVKLTYKITTDPPEKQLILELHDAIMQQLKKRNVTYRPHRRGHDPNAWTPDMDGHLIANYLTHPTPHELQAHLSTVFPTHRTCFELGRLRLRLQRLLRLALRKIYGDRDKFGLNEPATLSEYLVCKISRADAAMDVRKRLLSYYLDTDTNAMKLRWVKQVLEDYVKASRLQVQEIQDSSCQVIPKEQLKLQANCRSELTKKEERIATDKQENGDTQKEEKGNTTMEQKGKTLMEKGIGSKDQGLDSQPVHQSIQSSSEQYNQVGE